MLTSSIETCLRKLSPIEQKYLIERDGLASMEQLRKFLKFWEPGVDVKYIMLGRTSGSHKHTTKGHTTYAVRIKGCVLLFRIPYTDKPMQWVKSKHRSWNQPCT